jgi:hypothetical protein
MEFHGEKDGDHSAGADRLDTALMACVAAIESPGADDEALRDCLKELCAVARGEDMPIEHLLIRLKSAMDKSKSVRLLPAAERDAAREDIVSRLIAAYFAESE